MANKGWKDLSPGTRRLILVGGGIDATLRAAALLDLARRGSADVRGSKKGWVAANLLANSMGAVPLAYFVYGRKG